MITSCVRFSTSRPTYKSLSRSTATTGRKSEGIRELRRCRELQLWSFRLISSQVWSCSKDCCNYVLKHIRARYAFLVYAATGVCLEAAGLGDNTRGGVSCVPKDGVSWDMWHVFSKTYNRSSIRRFMVLYKLFSSACPSILRASH